MRRALAVLLAAGSLACNLGRAQQHGAAPALAPLGVHGPFELREGGRTHVLAHGEAAIGVDDLLLVTLSDADIHDQRSTGNTVGFSLDAGPGRGYFTGAELGVPVSLGMPSRHVSGNVVAAYRARVLVQPFRRAVGEHVRGTLDFRGTVAGEDGPVQVEGGDAFDVVLSLVNATHDGTAPATAAAHPVSGRFEQASFASRSAVVTYTTAPDGVRYVDAVWFFETAGVGCDGVYRARDGNHFEVTAPGLSFGGEGLPALTGHAMPIEPSFHYGHDSWSDYLFGYAPPAWLRFDALALREGTTARGSVYAANLPGQDFTAGTVRPGHVEGTFTATVCARRPDPVLPPPPAPPQMVSPPPPAGPS